MTDFTIIHTIRHAETEYGMQKRYAGKIDVPLNEIGRRNAVKASEKIADLKYDILITSKLKRSLETARYLVNGNAVKQIQTKLCNERGFGVMEGMTWEEVQKLTPPVMFIEVGNDLHSVNPEGAEPFEEVWDRAKKFRNLVLSKYAGSKILIVSHGVFLQLFHGMLRGLSLIESLGFAYPAKLELNSFQFLNSSLVEAKSVNLNGNEAANW